MVISILDYERILRPVLSVGDLVIDVGSISIYSKRCQFPSVGFPLWLLEKKIVLITAPVLPAGNVEDLE